jgi:hypothetical protein
MVKWGEFKVQRISDTVWCIVFINYQGEKTKIVNYPTEVRATKVCRLFNESFKQR